jgi:hypothetical protein
MQGKIAQESLGDGGREKAGMASPSHLKLTSPPSLNQGATVPIFILQGNDISMSAT